MLKAKEKFNNKRSQEMKMNNFKVREIDGKVAQILTDKQAGELYKAICAYNFNNEEYRGKDMLVKSVFSLMKEAFDKDRFFRETGKLGGVKSANMKRENDNFSPCIAKTVIGGDIVSDVIKSFIDDIERAEKTSKTGDIKNVAKA